MATPPHSHSHGHSHPDHPEPPTGGPSADPAQESLVGALHASFNVLRVVMVVLVVLYLFSGIFRVEPDQQGLIARLGKLRMTQGEQGETPVFGPGWHGALPDPFDAKYTLTGKVLELKTTHFMFEHDQAASSKNLAEIVFPLADLTPGQQGAMLTGDRNLSHGRWEIQYRIQDAAAFLTHVGEDPDSFQPLLTRLVESAVVREVAGRTVEDVTREKVDAVREGVHRRLQAALDRLETGVRVEQVVAYTIEPGAVRPAFLDVTRAQNEKKTLMDRAEEQATEIINAAAGSRQTHAELLTLITEYGNAQLQGTDDAQLAAMLSEIDVQLLAAEEQGAGQVAVTLSAARAEANDINDRVRREYEQFQRYQELRAAQPRLAVLGLWVQMRREILSNEMNEIFFVPDADEIEILVNRDPQRQIRLEEQRALDRQRGGIQRANEPGQPTRRLQINGRRGRS